MVRMTGTSRSALGWRSGWGGKQPAAGVCVLALLLAAGCAKTQIIKEGPVGPLSKSEVITRLNTQAELTRTVRAKLAVKVQTSSMKGPESCEGSLAAEYPDRLRIRGRHDMLDYPPFDIGSDGATWFVHVHFRDENVMHLGPVQLLDESFDAGVPLSPRDIVLALGIGRLDENPPAHELFFTKNPGSYLITEVVTNASGRYISKRITVDPTLVAITRMETYRPDGGIDMIADMTYDPKAGTTRIVPVSARIRLLRKETLLLDLTLKEREAGVTLPAKVFTVPSTEDIPHVYRHDSH
jgi:hypothetical protein